MLDLKFIRENAELVRQAIANRQTTAPLDEILQLDKERRQKVTGLEELRRVRKESARDRSASPEEGRKLRDKINALEQETGKIDEQLNDLTINSKLTGLPPFSQVVGPVTQIAKTMQGAKAEATAKELRRATPATIIPAAF